MSKFWGKILKKMLPIQIKPENTDLDIIAYTKRSRSTVKVQNEDGIGQQLWLIFRTLHLFGSSPVQIQKDKLKSKSYGELYNFKLYSPQSIFPLCTAIFYSYFWIKYLLELGFRQTLFGDSFLKSKEYFFAFTGRTKNGYSAEKTQSSIVSIYVIARLVLFIFPTQHILSIAFSWLDAPLLVKFLNNWHTIEENYGFLFCTRRNNNNDSHQKILKLPMVNLRKWRNRFLLYYVAIPTAIFWPLYINASVHYDDLIQVFVIVFSSFHFIIYPMFDAAKTVLMYKAVAEAFQQVKVGMSRTIVRNSSFADPLHIRSCRQLLELLRSQCRLLGQLQTKQELLQLTSMFTLITFEIYIILNGDYSQRNASKVILVMGVFTGWLVTTLFIKVLMADKITLKELEIAEILASSEPNNSILDPLVAAEIKFIHDMILLHPSTISFGNYLTFNKKLILTIFSQVATYIIVLMQLTYYSRT